MVVIFLKFKQIFNASIVNKLYNVLGDKKIFSLPPIGDGLPV